MLEPNEHVNIQKGFQGAKFFHGKGKKKRRKSASLINLYGYSYRVFNPLT